MQAKQTKTKNDTNKELSKFEKELDRFDTIPPKKSKKTKQHKSLVTVNDKAVKSVTTSKRVEELKVAPTDAAADEQDQSSSQHEDVQMKPANAAVKPSTKPKAKPSTKPTGSKQRRVRVKPRKPLSAYIYFSQEVRLLSADFGSLDDVVLMLLRTLLIVITDDLFVK